MDISVWVWAGLIVGLFAVFAVDLWIVDRGEPREFTLRQAGLWVSFYLVLAILFGIGLFIFGGGAPAGEFFAGVLGSKVTLSQDDRTPALLQILSESWRLGADAPVTGNEPR